MLLGEALLAAALMFAIGLGPAAAQDDPGKDAGVEGAKAAHSGGFTPPLFGAPEQRIAAGSRDLTGSDPCPNEPNAEIRSADIGRAEAGEAATSN